jgi:hypothetical protein
MRESGRDGCVMGVDVGRVRRVCEYGDGDDAGGCRGAACCTLSLQILALA